MLSCITPLLCLPLLHFLTLTTSTNPSPYLPIPQGYFAASGSFARILFPLLAGFVAEKFGNSAVFGLMAIILLFSTFCIIFFRDFISKVIQWQCTVLHCNTLHCTAHWMHQWGQAGLTAIAASYFICLPSSIPSDSTGNSLHDIQGTLLETR